MTGSIQPFDATFMIELMLELEPLRMAIMLGYNLPLYIEISRGRVNPLKEDSHCDCIVFSSEKGSDDAGDSFFTIFYDMHDLNEPYGLWWGMDKMALKRDMVRFQTREGLFEGIKNAFQDF